MTRCAVVGGYITILVMGNWLRNGKWRGTVTMRGVLRYIEIIHFPFLEVTVAVTVVVEVGHGVSTVVRGQMTGSMVGFQQTPHFFIFFL